MKYFVANHKNYLSLSDVKTFIKVMKKFNNTTDNKIIISPSYLYFPLYSKLDFDLCSQNFDLLSPLSGGISLNQIKSFGINCSIVGHSDSRWKLNESDETISIKTKSLIENNMIPIICFGEKDEVPVENAINYLKNQIDAALIKISTKDVEKVIFAYEPVWSISNGKNYSKVLDVDSLEIIISSIKEHIKQKYNSNVSILYGGSVNINNIEELNKINCIDGYLIGKSSINADDFISLIIHN